MGRKLKITYVSPEVAPFAKSGELADVASSLPKYLSQLGMEVSVFLPKYRLPEVESLPKELVYADLSVPLGEAKAKANVYKSGLGKYDIYFIDNPKYFWRESIYGTGKGEYLDNDERFVFFSRAFLEFLLRAKMAADIIHCNGWQTALVPVFLKTLYAHKALFKKSATLFTLHNVAYQGEFPAETLALTGLNWNYFNQNQLSFNGRFNFLKAGILFSDLINTVSLSYKRDILTGKHGFGLEGILKTRREDFFSIRNGIDDEVWNPETDPYLAANYTASDLRPKEKCKQDLLQEFGLALGTQAPVLGMVSYLTAHKGFDLVLEALEELMEMELRLVMLGQGDEKYEQKLTEAQRRFPGKMAVKLDMNPSLAHKVTAGADMFLIPSRHEPCGLNQLYALRYGTVPVVRATGGLEETVIPFDRKTLKGNGFVFKEFSAAALLQALKEALQCYPQPDLWDRIRQAGMRGNFSWKRAARRYAWLYQKALERKGGA